MDAADDTNPAQASPRTLGQTFAAERERQGLSRADAAQRLHMSAWQVEALETGDYSRLPKGTFLRGFVRNYAKVLGIGADDALSLLPEHAPRDQKPGIVVPTQNIRFDPIGDRLQNPYVKATLLALVAVAVGFAAMYWWVFIRPTPPGALARKGEAQVAAVTPFASTQPSAPAAAKPPMPEAPANAAAAPPRTEPPRPEPAKAQPAKPEAAKAEAPKAEPAKSQPTKPDAAKAPGAKPEPAKAEASAPAGGEVLRAGSGSAVLKFVFKGSSWVEVRDARGKVIVSRLNAAGSEAEIAGNPPLDVIVGNAPEVELFYNDREFDLEPHTKVAVARFTVK